MIKNWIKESVSFKLIIISILILLLLIPMSMIKSLIHERERTSSEVTHEIGSKWANQQTLTGPVISIPYKKYFKDDGKVKSVISYAHFLPEELNIHGNITPEERYRGIYKSIVYGSSLSITGQFKNIGFNHWDIPKENILWDQAYISMGITDMRGISNELTLKIDGKDYQVDPGMTSNDVISNGISTPIKLIENKDLSFSINLALNGSESINFIPVGKTTKVNINSNWNAPSFNGSFLPKERNIDDNGFDASWLILHLNRNYPQQWLGAKYKLYDSSFGIDLLIPVNQYLKSERAVKYAIMFIALTFLVFFFAEILNKKRIHPIQYLLVGFGLIMFYTLLLSLSEHISFDWSYLISSILVVALITWYTHVTLNKRKSTLTILGVLSTLYIFLYTILQLEAYSLLMGSVGLFIILATIMYLSRKIDWNSSLDPEQITNKVKEKFSE